MNLNLLEKWFTENCNWYILIVVKQCQKILDHFLAKINIPTDINCKKGKCFVYNWRKLIFCICKSIKKMEHQGYSRRSYPLISLISGSCFQNLNYWFCKLTFMCFDMLWHSVPWFNKDWHCDLSFTYWWLLCTSLVIDWEAHVDDDRNCTWFDEDFVFFWVVT